MWWGSVSLMSCAQHALSNPLHWPPFWVRGKEILTFCCSTESGMQGQVILLICSVARSVGGLRLALSLGSVQHKEWSATFFSSTKTGKRLQDLQAAVGQQLALPYSTLHQAQNNVLPVPSSPSQLLCYLLEPRNNGTFSCNQPRFPGTLWRHMALLFLCFFIQEPRLDTKCKLWWPNLVLPMCLNVYLWISRLLLCIPNDLNI